VNAFQHVSRGGEVRVTASAVAPPSHVPLTVHNDGPAIPCDVSPRVFEPFFTTKPRGTGLGLAIVRRLCTDVSAKVEVASDDTGVAFTLTLPAIDG